MNQFDKTMMPPASPNGLRKDSVDLTALAANISAALLARTRRALAAFDEAQKKRDPDASASATQEVTRCLAAIQAELGGSLPHSGEKSAPADDFAKVADIGRTLEQPLANRLHEAVEAMRAAYANGDEAAFKLAKASAQDVADEVKATAAIKKAFADAFSRPLRINR